MWVLTQQLSSIAKPFRENVAAIVLSYTSSAKTTKAIFEDNVGDLSRDRTKLLDCIETNREIKEQAK